MEILRNCGIIADIELIESISGADQYFEVIFSSKDKTKYKIVLESVWDMRWSIENASIDRFYQFRKHLPEDITNSNVFIVENSEYVKYFANQVSGTRPVVELKHYIFHDNVDTTLDVLANKEPMIVKV